MGTTSSESIIQDVDLALKALEIFYCANGDAVEGLADKNIHICKVVGEVKRFNWGCARTKGKGRKCKLTKNMFLNSDLLKLFLNKKHNITELFHETTLFND